MSKLLLLLVIAAAAVLFLNGVVEISFHPDRLSNISTNLATLTKGGLAPERGKILLTRTNRSIQHLFIHDREKRLELAVLNVNEDAERLSETLEKGVTDAGVLVPQAELLLGSIKYVRTAAEEAPVDTVAELKEESAVAFGKAQQALSQLQALREEYAAIGEEFDALTQALEDQVGTLGLESQESQPTATEADAETKTELRF
jgi:hypothetical protein